MLANRPYILGVTGGIASGKSAACAHLETLGAKQVDADKISRWLTEGQNCPEALSAIREAFGDGVFREDGTLDRKALGAVVFQDTALRRRLEGILHPLIQREMMDQVERAGQEGAKVVLLNVPLLFETGMDVLCDEIWVLYTNEETQVARVMLRDSVDRDQALLRIKSQMPTEEKLARATEKISTDRPMEKTQAELAALYQGILKKLN